MSKKEKNKKIRVPESVKLLAKSNKGFAKATNITTSKNMSKSEKKRAIKQLQSERSEWDAKGINIAVKLLIDNKPETPGFNKVMKGVDALITDSGRMKRVSKEYANNVSDYPHMRYLPNMILQTIEYYGRDGITEDEKAIAADMDIESLLKFSEKVLKKQIKHYKHSGCDSNVAFQMACVVPTSKILTNRIHLKKIIQTLYSIAAEKEVDVKQILKSIYKVDGKCKVSKKEFLSMFYLEFLMTRKTNKNAQFTDTQKDLHESLIEESLNHINNDLKSREIRQLLMEYISRRKTAEKYKNDGKRVLCLMDIANSNSTHHSIKECILEIIKDKKDNESYLG